MSLLAPGPAAMTPLPPTAAAPVRSLLPLTGWAGAVALACLYPVRVIAHSPLARAAGVPAALTVYTTACKRAA